MKASGCLWNGMTVVMLLLTALTCVWTGAVFANPQAPYNPLRPTLPGTASVLDATPGPAGTPTDAVQFPTLPPEWTATFTPQPATDTATPRPTATQRPSATVTVEFTPIGPTPTESDTPEITRTPTRTVRPPTATPDTGGYPPTEAVPSPTSGAYP